MKEEELTGLEDFIIDAVAKGILSIQSIESEPRVYERVVRAALQKRNAGLKKAQELEKNYEFTFVSTIPLRETDELSQIKVEDIMTKEVSTVSKDFTINELLDCMTKEHHIGYPVVNWKGEPIGTVTLEEASAIDKDQREQMRVEEVMRKEVVTANPGETGLEVLKKMSKYQTGRVVVVDPKDKSKLLGIVTKTDLMDALTKLVHQTA